MVWLFQADSNFVYLRNFPEYVCHHHKVYMKILVCNNWSVVFQWLLFNVGVSLYGVLTKINRAELYFLVQITLNILAQIVSFHKYILIVWLTLFCIILCNFVLINNDNQIPESIKRFPQFIKPFCLFVLLMILDKYFKGITQLLLKELEEKNTCL